MEIERSGRDLGADAVQVVLAVGLVAGHFTTMSTYVYPHYVLLILAHPRLLREAGIRLAPWQRIYVSFALFVHPMGALHRFYTTIWWFDHVTHFLSATLVAAIGYVLARARLGQGGRARWAVPAITMVFVLIAGVLWEVIETLTPILTVYGPNDTAWDYVWNTLGGLAVIVVGPKVLDEAAEGLASRLDRSTAD